MREGRRCWSWHDAVTAYDEISFFQPRQTGRPSCSTGDQNCRFLQQIVRAIRRGSSTFRPARRM